ncbi:MAG TPA: ABC transporter ATP-binding protein [Candidatus Agrococcus pullicola]|uniref:ABC transporter ATP-binding protein n=1 Tax=Candidatus Agrococcus pullicola TaxID=2838429 RepID=A0A9D2C990_9MICO|nr:ABC transporter ATP-binding protein [Candidatus Agrococcus pullicola]
MSLIEVDDLVVEYATRDRTVRALDGVSLRVEAGERLALVGESGSGKSTLGVSLGALLPAPARIAEGSVTVNGYALGELDRDGLRTLRRETLGFIPQDPIATLDPTKRIGKQLAMVVGDLGGDTSRAALANLLEDVRINDPAAVLRRFPHQLSGGMAQRVAVAIAMVRKPRVLVADEPTAALDANVRRDVLRLIFDIAAETGATVIWLSHDLDAVAKWCERVAVMYRGKVVEDGPVGIVLQEPEHPYTKSLLDSMPSRLQHGVEVRTYTEMLRMQGEEGTV